MKLTKRQWEVLDGIERQCSAEQCIGDCKYEGVERQCTGDCKYGWAEPLEGGTLRIARTLADLGLVNLANGRYPRWIAGHITRAGREEVANRRPVTPRPRCKDYSPAWFTGRWRDWHRGHGCNLDDGKERTSEGTAEIEAGRPS